MNQYNMTESKFISQLLSSLCHTPKDMPENIIELLCIRGFLVEANGELNNFSTDNDIKAYQHYIKAKTSDELFELFKPGSVAGFEVCWLDNIKWQKLFASNRIYGEKIDVMALEPFVARYCKSLALIGVHTYLSCDGWHDNRRKGGIKIGFSDRYSFSWMKILHDNDKKLVDTRLRISIESIRDRMIKIPIGGFIQREQVYYALNETARIIYNNRYEYLALKNKVVSMLKYKPKNQLSFEEVYAMMYDAYCNIQVL